MTFQETKDSFRRLKLLVSEFIRKSPKFDGDEELATTIMVEFFKFNHPEIKLDTISFQKGNAEILFTDSSDVWEVSEFIKGSVTRTVLEQLIEELELILFEEWKIK